MLQKLKDKSTLPLPLDYPQKGISTFVKRWPSNKKKFTTISKNYLA